MEKTVQKAIEDITYRSEKFPAESFQIISENKELALPYLTAALDKAILEKDNLDENYQLHFYALFFLGQFQEKDSFPKIMELAALPEEVLDYLIGDAITSALSDVLYNTYNGDLALLEATIRNSDVDDFARSGMLDVMGQLYFDGNLAKKELQDFIRGIVNGGEDIGGYIYTAVAAIICTCHFVDMLPEVRRLYDEGRVDSYAIGDYDDCIDMMFRYEDEKHLCITPMNAADMLRRWAMFDQTPEKEFNEKDFNKLFRAVDAMYNKQSGNVKVGRNDLCPCGSGKKYKKCCLNKPKSSIDLIESDQERKKWLKNYPVSAAVREDGRVYLADFWDSESIEIDKAVYLALHHRAIPIWHSEQEEVVENRKRAYLQDAFEKCTQKMEREKIATIREYDEKYAIHYRCEEWMKVLEELLKKSGDKELYNMVLTYCKKKK